MFDHTIPFEPGTKQVVIQAARTLEIRGVAAPEIRFEASGPEVVQGRQDGEVLHLDCSARCELQLPRDIALRITSARRNVDISDVHGPIEIDDVGGNLRLDMIESAVVRSVGGNLNVSEMRGDGKLGDVGGNTHLRDIRSGQVTVTTGGNLHVNGCISQLSGHAGGNANLDIAEVLPEAPVQIKVECGGNLKARFAEAVNATVTTRDATKSQSISLGDGSGQVQLRAGGLIWVNANAESQRQRFNNIPYEAGFEHLADRVGEWAESFEEKMTAFGERMAQQFGQGFRNPPPAPPVYGWARGTRQPEGNPRPAAPDPDLDQSRMAILRMLEEKKITAAEAEQLLKALA